MNLKDLRIKARLTQEQAALLSGLSIKFISEIENYRRNPSDKAKKRLAKAYNVTPVDIFLACQRTNRSRKKKEEAKINAN